MKRPYFVASFVLIVVSLVFSLVLYPRLPDQVPTHWNFHGQVDAYGSKVVAAFLMPGIGILILAMFSALNWLSPRHFKLDSFRPTWEFVTFLIVALTTYDHFIFLLAAYGWLIDLNRAVFGGLFLFLALIGNVLGKVRRNFYIGIRTPWTIASERVWNDTHRMGARLFVAAGVLGFIAAMVGMHPAVPIGILIAAVLASVGYSLFDYKRLERQNRV
jgi:uncharacterized membrane protein